MSASAECPDLLSYAEGGLDPTRRRQVERHLRTCTDCDRWLHTYGELYLVSSCTTQAPSTVLAEYAVRPQRLDAAKRTALEAHLRSCDRCLNELDLVRAALDQARQEPFRAPLRAIFTPLRFNPARAAITAALVVLSTAGAWLLWSPLDQTVPNKALAPATVDVEGAVQDRVAMVIENTRVHAGGALSIRAHGPVAFGNGFSVGPGARLRVEIVQTKPAADRRPAGPQNLTTERNMQ